MFTPLRPAGRLPLKGGDRRFRRVHLSSDPADWRKRSLGLIFLLEGEMAGRPEGGVLSACGDIRESMLRP
ncbi:lytic murein transglycosylase [Aquamicrobium sp. LC103]|nr:lytic murein transglycosylase [Aquamicrobium sp. LC103]